MVGEHYYWRVRPTVHVHITAHCARRASPVSMRRPGLRCGSRSLSRRRRSLASSRRLPHGMTRRSWRCGRTGRRARTRSCPSSSPARLARHGSRIVVGVMNASPPLLFIGRRPPSSSPPPPQARAHGLELRAIADRRPPPNLLGTFSEPSRRLPTSRPRAATSPAPPSSPRVRSTASCAARLGQHRKECVSAQRTGAVISFPHLALARWPRPCHVVRSTATSVSLDFLVARPLRT